MQELLVLPRRRVWAGGMILVAGLILIGVYQHIMADKSVPAGATNRADSLSAPGSTSKPGLPPWGALQIVRIAIERPDEFISLNHYDEQPNRWFFENYSAQRLGEFLAHSGLTTKQLATVLDTNRWEVVSNGCYIHPDLELVAQMGSPARQKIYSVLAASPQNYFQFHAFTFRSDKLDEWFEYSGLATSTVALVEKFLFRRGQAVCFADVPVVFSRLATTQERRLLLKTLSRHATVLVKLDLEPDSDIGALVNYWGKGGRAKDVKPLLESLREIPNGTSIDVVHLLPPFARMRLYTYPFPTEDPVKLRHDCFWTAMNFFLEEPDDRFIDFGYTKKILQAEYYPIQDDPTYGDVLLFVDAAGVTIHAAVYIAGDILFTKNGAHFNQPWIFMELDDLLAAYPNEQPLKILAYRHRGI